MDRPKALRHFFLATVWTLLTQSGARGQATLHVDADAPGAQDGSSWTDAFHHLQDALAVALARDEIRLAAGVLRPDQGAGRTAGDREATFTVPQGLALRGGYAGFGAANPDLRDPASFPTELSGDLLGNDGPGFTGFADNSGHVVTLEDADDSTILDGLTIRSGHADDDFFDWGALVLRNASPLVVDCQITRNLATRSTGQVLGAGVYVENGSPTFVRCTFVDNSVRAIAPFVTASGAAIFTSGGVPRFLACAFEGNLSNASTFSDSIAHGGAAACAGGSPTFETCVFRDNDCLGRSTGPFSFARGTGGGLWLTNADATLSHCLFVGNGAEALNVAGGAAEAQGGALYLEGDGQVLVNSCRFLGNTVLVTGGPSTGRGGAIKVLHVNGSLTLVNSVLDGNLVRVNATGSALAQGGALDLGILLGAGNSLVASCTLAGNAVEILAGLAPVLQAGGIRNQGSGSTSVLRNSILWGNTEDGSADEPAQITDLAGTLAVDYTTIEGLTGALGGVGNLGADPLWVDADGADDLPGTEDDDLRLTALSPCVDAADGGALPPDVLDQDCDGDAVEALPFDVEGRVRAVDAPASPDTGAGSRPLPDQGAHEYLAELPVDHWIDLGGGSAGAFGTPLLVGRSALCGFEPIELHLDSAPPNVLTLLFVSLSSSPFSVLGGTLHAVPPALELLLSTTPAGTFLGGTLWPPGFPGGVDLWFQFIVQDVSVPDGLILSNAVRATTP